MSINKKFSEFIEKSSKELIRSDKGLINPFNYISLGEYHSSLIERKLCCPYSLFMRGIENYINKQYSINQAIDDIKNCLFIYRTYFIPRMENIINITKQFEHKNYEIYLQKIVEDPIDLYKDINKKINALNIIIRKIEKVKDDLKKDNNNNQLKFIKKSINSLNIDEEAISYLTDIGIEFYYVIENLE